MRGIPEDRIRTAERRLRNRMTALEDAREAIADAQSEATSLTGPLANTDTMVQTSRSGDRIPRAVEKILAARERLQTLEAWEAVFCRVDEDFPPGSPEGTVRDLCLIARRKPGERWAAPVMTLTDLARAEGVDRQTIARRKEMVLGRVAYYAAEAGLMTEEGREP